MIARSNLQIPLTFEIEQWKPLSSLAALAPFYESKRQANSYAAIGREE
jgi:hypothetical protein